MAPMLDDRNDSASAMQMDGIEFWNRSYSGFGWNSLLGDVHSGADVPQYAAPARRARRCAAGWLTRPTLDRPCASNGHAWIRSGYPYSRHHIDVREN